MSGLQTLKSWIGALTELGLMLLALGIVCALLVGGSNLPFFGNVAGNIIAFVKDLGANGLQFKREKNQPFDSVDAVGKTTAFDGDWRKAKLSEQEYTKIYTAHDEDYSQTLQALLDTLKKPS